MVMPDALNTAPGPARRDFGPRSFFLHLPAPGCL